MERNEIMEDKIDNYLTGKLSASDREAFEREMAADADLQEEVEQQKLIMGAVVNFRKDELKEYIRLNTIEAERKRSAGPMWMSIAAALVLAVGAGFYVFYKNQKSGGPGSEMAVHTPKTTPDKSGNLVLEDSVTIKMPDNQKVLAEKKSDTKDMANEAISGNGALVEASGKTDSEVHKLKIDTQKPAITNGIVNNATQGTYNWSSQNNMSYSRSDKTQSFELASPRTAGNKKAKYVKKKADSLNIQADILIKDTFLEILSVGKTPADSYTGGSFGDSLNFKNLPLKAEVKIWKSSVHFKGFIFYKNTLSLYGIPSNTKVVLKSIEGDCYMKLKGKVYRLKDENYYYDFSDPVVDKSLIKQLGF